MGRSKSACVDRSELRDALKRICQALRVAGRLMITAPVHRGFLHRSLKLGLGEFLAVMWEAGFRGEDNHSITLLAHAASALLYLLAGLVDCKILAKLP